MHMTEHAQLSLASRRMRWMPKQRRVIKGQKQTMLAVAKKKIGIVLPKTKNIAEAILVVEFLV